MDLTRVYLSPGLSMDVPFCWVVWTCQGFRFRRQGEAIEWQNGPFWMPCVTEAIDR